jgi:hypothetical protein
METLFPNEFTRERAQNFVSLLLKNKRMRKLVVFTGRDYVGRELFYQALCKIFGSYLITAVYDNKEPDNIRTQTRGIVYDPMKIVGGCVPYDQIRKFVQSDNMDGSNDKPLTEEDTEDILGSRYTGVDADGNEYGNYNISGTREKMIKLISQLKYPINFNTILFCDEVPGELKDLPTFVLPFDGNTQGPINEYIVGTLTNPYTSFKDFGIILGKQEMYEKKSDGSWVPLS